MVNLGTAFWRHFPELVVAERMRHIPADARQNDISFKMVAFELDRHLPVPREPLLKSLRQTGVRTGAQRGRISEQRHEAAVEKRVQAGRP